MVIVGGKTLVHAHTMTEHGEPGWGEEWRGTG